MQLHLRLGPLLLSCSLLFSANPHAPVTATEPKCQEDCRSIARDRIVGPTRPWHERDELGNDLYLTRPYPYAKALDGDYGGDLEREDSPSPFSMFCELGCSLFYFSTDEPTLLSDCTDACDGTYRYNVTVGYNDLAEVARWECRDGCQIALKRCEPGHYCSQVQVINHTIASNINSTRTYTGGIMRQCPPGTFRDVSYNAVVSCVACPQGRFRERTRGTSLESCDKCPINTYASQVGSASKEECLRCPAGTFTTKSGSAYCKCITPGACANDQLPSPADAEKRDTAPFIGRW